MIPNKTLVPRKKVQIDMWQMKRHTTNHPYLKNNLPRCSKVNLLFVPQWQSNTSVVVGFLLELPTFQNLQRQPRCSPIHWSCLASTDRQHTRIIQHSAKYDMLAIQPVCLGTSNKELATIGIGPGIGHGQHAWSFVFMKKVFVFEGWSILQWRTNVRFVCLYGMRHD